MSKQTLELHWGILATGGIAQTFAKDLSIDPKTRNVSTIKHSVAAAASSSSKTRAQEFLKEVDAPSSAKAYGSYEELVKDPDVDIIYIATPHSHHFQNAMLCFEHGKNVLCEKALTVNAAQARVLVEKARSKDLFFMEAVWTRYFPLSIYVRELITSGHLGSVHRVIADLSMAMDPATSFADGKSRMVNVDLAGGALLDLGIYSLTWLFQTLYTTQPESQRRKPSVQTIMSPFKTGADVHTSMILEFPRGEGEGPVHGVATTSMLVAGDPDGKGSAGPTIRVQGTKGEVQVFHPAFRPVKTKLVMKDGTVEDKEWPQPGPGKGSGFFNKFGSDKREEGEGQGMFWEADEAGYALLEGRKESRYQSLEESVVIMEVMDEVRKQGGLKYPEKIESVEYPLNLT
ncbi:uncharacterized protein KY384_009262 [Bacidia gigantensis]|uniref:uncharacterized protein n=1 Tax=Bacidia gigantensis TaxID=2732470 RepID=UPI001D03CFD7|nr:uncharacterized protein KY384_009262 [Bacidia gigantensis]KAG8525618.1 hypothetical protein KY384_009262 [Bacidia gigantensis]